jgi:hypothetical protein
MVILARRAGMLGSDRAIAMHERPTLVFGLLTVLRAVSRRLGR